MIFLLVLAYIGGTFLSAGATYIAGRIILPEMGLTAPEYWPWFWGLSGPRMRLCPDRFHRARDRRVMTYMVVGVDGNLYTRTKKPAQPRLQAEAGQPTLAIVNLRHLPAEKSSMCVVTAAHHPDITHPRNPVGAAVAATFGAEQHPYAGPVMFVGQTGPTIHDLPRAMRIAVAEVHAAVVLAAAGAETAFGPVWAQAVRDYARRVVEVAGPEWLDLPPVDLFGRDVTGRSWWLCPAGGCDHAEMFHKDGRCWFNTCECGKGEL